jgi:hypothetical protein
MLDGIGKVHHAVPRLDRVEGDNRNTGRQSDARGTQPSLLKRVHRSVEKSMTEVIGGNLVGTSNAGGGRSSGTWGNAYAASEGGGGGRRFGPGPLETKVRSQPLYQDPWTIADVASLGLDRVTGRGDPDGTYQGRITGTFHPAGGKDALITGLQHTSPEYGKQIQQDEFEIVELANGKYIVNLAGVIDLSEYLAGVEKKFVNPADPLSLPTGLDRHNQSVRDLDRNATRSSVSADIKDNQYALMVRDYILANVPRGADVMIIGHSYGADTALDLASDPAFNNKQTGVNVTHAVSAGYYSPPQLDSIANDTKVLVLMNNQDVVINAESRNPLLPPEDKPLRWLGVVGPSDLPISDVTTQGDNIVVSRFNGGLGTDAGHHPDRYVNHVDDASNDPIADYLNSLTDAGYGTRGTSIAIDVSVTKPITAPPPLGRPESGPPPAATTTGSMTPATSQPPPPGVTTTTTPQPPPAAATTTTTPPQGTTNAHAR